MSKYATYLSYTSEVPKSLDRNIKIKWSSQYKWDFFAFVLCLCYYFYMILIGKGGQFMQMRVLFLTFQILL